MRTGGGETVHVYLFLVGQISFNFKNVFFTASIVPDESRIVGHFAVAEGYVAFVLA